MLTLYIVKSGDPSAKNERLIESFGDDISIPSAIQAVRFNQIHSLKAITPWYGVFYDNEIIDIQLKESLRIFLTNEVLIDVYTVMKKHIDKESPTGFNVTQAPRFFRNNIQISPNGLMPMRKDVRFERILNGFVLEANGQ